MRNSLFFFLFLLVTLDCISQDLIVRNGQDSIECRIDSIGLEDFHFSYNYRMILGRRSYNSGNEMVAATLSKKKVTAYEYGYYLRMGAEKDSLIALKLYPKFRVAISGGLGYQIQKIDNNFHESRKDHLKKMKFGYVVGGEFQWFFTESIGISMNYRQFGTSTPLDTFLVITEIPYTVNLFMLSEKITTQFIGPGFTYRDYNKRMGSSLLIGFSFGYFSYKNDFKYVNLEANTLKGVTAGIGLSFGYEKSIGKDFYLGFNLSALIGSLTEVESTIDGELTVFPLEEKENLSRFDLTIVLSFSK